MAKHRYQLPQLSSAIIVTGERLETALIFNKGIDLLKSSDGKQILYKLLCSI